MSWCGTNVTRSLQELVGSKHHKELAGACRSLQEFAGACSPPTLSSGIPSRRHGRQQSHLRHLHPSVSMVPSMPTSLVASSLTASLRFDGALDANITEFQTNLVPVRCLSLSSRPISSPSVAANLHHHLLQKLCRLVVLLSTVFVEF